MVAISLKYADRRSIDFSVTELTGAIGDSITVLPIVVAVAALTDYSLAHLLLGFAVFQIVWGLYYGLPVSVEPMKALAALAIAGGLSASELAGAGFLAGGILLFVGQTRTLKRIETYIGQPVIRGVQFAVALLLLQTGIQLSLENIVLASGSVLVALVVIASGYRQASALIVLGIGIFIAGLETGLQMPSPPALIITLPTGETMLSSASLKGTAAQLAMTVGNAAVATSLLLSDYFDADVSADDLATSMGVMNLVAIPVGAMPMCHGSGGIAGKYAFGARTAGANVILGLLYGAAGVSAVGIIAAFPLAMLGVILALVAVELGRTSLRSDRLLLTLAIGIVGLLTNVGIAFIAGLIGYQLLARLPEKGNPLLR